MKLDDLICAVLDAIGADTLEMARHLGNGPQRQVRDDMGPTFVERSVGERLREHVRQALLSCGKAPDTLV